MSVFLFVATLVLRLNSGSFNYMRAKVEQIEAVINSIYETKSTRKALELHDVRMQAFYEFIGENPILAESHMRAQCAVAEDLAEEIVHIADTAEDHQKARNQIDARKWYAAAIKPHKFGSRIDISVNNVVDLKAALSDALARLPQHQITEQLKEAQAIDVTTELIGTETGVTTCQGDTEKQGCDTLTAEDIFD